MLKLKPIIFGTKGDTAPNLKAFVHFAITNIGVRRERMVYAHIKNIKSTKWMFEPQPSYGKTKLVAIGLSLISDDIV